MKLSRRRVAYAVLLLITIPLGIGWRMLPLGLSPFLFKYGGSALWAIALYWLLAVCLPGHSSRALACVAAMAAALIEFSRLWHLASLDAFRLTLAGRLLLGRYFSVKNIAAYWLAIALAASLDQRFVRRAAGRDSLTGDGFAYDETDVGIGHRREESEQFRSRPK